MRLKYRGAPKDWYIRRLACHHVLSRHKRIWDSDTRHCQRTRCIGLGGGSAYSPTWFGKLGSWQKLETRSTKAHRHGPDRIQTCCMISLTPGKSIIPGRPSSFEVSTMASSNRIVSRFEVGQRLSVPYTGDCDDGSLTSSSSGSVIPQFLRKLSIVRTPCESGLSFVRV